MSVMDLLKSPRGIGLLQDLLDASQIVIANPFAAREQTRAESRLEDAVGECVDEIATCQAVDNFKSIDGTPAKLDHKWIPGG